MPESKHRRRRGRGTPRGAGSSGSLAASRPRRKKTNKIYLIASVVIAVLVIAGFAVGGSLGGGGGGATARTGNNEEYKDGIGVRQEPMPTGADGLNLHVSNGQPVEYNTAPPTSGDHWAELASCGFYREELPDEQIVHNLEHGNIVVSYNLVNPVEIDELRDVIDGIGLANLWGIARSYDGIPEGKVALTTWGVLDTMDGIDPGRIEAFFEYAGNLGPERVPC